MMLRVLVPPEIDKSNIIGNPLAILNKTISLECPATGIPGNCRLHAHQRPINCLLPSWSTEQL